MKQASEDDGLVTEALKIAGSTLIEKLEIYLNYAYTIRTFR